MESSKTYKKKRLRGRPLSPGVTTSPARLNREAHAELVARVLAGYSARCNQEHFARRGLVMSLRAVEKFAVRLRRSRGLQRGEVAGVAIGNTSRPVAEITIRIFDERLAADAALLAISRATPTGKQEARS